MVNDNFGAIKYNWKYPEKKNNNREPILWKLYIYFYYYSARDLFLFSPRSSPSVALIKCDNARPVSTPRAEISKFIDIAKCSWRTHAILASQHSLESIPIKMTAFSPHTYSICRTKSIAHAILAMATIILIEEPWSWYWNALKAPMCQEDTLSVAHFENEIAPKQRIDANEMRSRSPWTRTCQWRSRQAQHRARNATRHTITRAYGIEWHLRPTPQCMHGWRNGTRRIAGNKKKNVFSA